MTASNSAVWYNRRVQTVCLTVREARTYLLDGFALGSWQSLESVREALDVLEFVQEDSIDVCGRMHELILWPRVKDYSSALLHASLYGPDAHAFEHYLPNLSAIPLDDFPHFVHRMKARAEKPGRWGGLFPEEEPVAQKLLDAMDERGPLRTRALGSEDGHMQSGWGTRSTIVSQVAEKLYLTGTLAIARRDGFERHFDRLERIHPGVHAYLAGSLPLPDPIESQRHLVRKRLRAKRLFRPKRDEVTLLGKDAFVQVEIEGLIKPWFALAEYYPLAPDNGEADSSGEVFFLAPLDPLVYDRQRNRELFGFDYTWEVYVPEAKRKWGYYVLPILGDGRLIGRLHPKLDRKSGTLFVKSLTYEQPADEARFGAAVQARLEDYASFLERPRSRSRRRRPCSASTSRNS